MNLSVQIDTSGLNRGIALALEYSKRTPAQLVNTAACEIAIVAKNTMPFVTVPKIDTDLNVASALVRKKRGKGFLKGVKSQRANREVGDMAGTNVPLAVLIIQARVTGPRSGSYGPSVSKYNQSTGFRYAISASPFKGVSRASGRAAMRAAVTRMINARHSSTKFLMSGWIPAVRIMLQYSVNRYRKGSSTGPPLEGAKSFYGGDLGSATPAQIGQTSATCTIENLIGMQGKNAASFDHALQLHGAPALQAAIDNEGRKQMDYYLMKSGKEELEDPVNKAWK